VTNFDLSRIQREIEYDLVGTPIYTSEGGTTESVMNVEVSKECEELGEWYRDYHKQLVDTYHELRREPGAVDTCEVPKELKEQSKRMEETNKKIDELLSRKHEMENAADLRSMWED